MNFINKALVYLVLLPKFIYRRMGVDTGDLAIILRTKLLMDDRRPNSIHVTRPQNAGKQISMATLGTMLISALMGLFFLISFALGTDLVTQVCIYFLLYMTMLTLTLITDFTSVLIDVRDNQIILPKPVSSKTFTLSRLLHIFIHINKIILPMSLAGLIFMVVKQGVWPAMTLLLALFPVGIFCILIINMVYLAILRITTPERFKTIISYVQIAMTVLIYGISQIVPRLIDASEVMALSISGKAWRWAVPPYWFARGWMFISRFSGDRENLIGVTLLILVPIFSVWIVVKYLAPSFAVKLASMGSSAEDKNPASRSPQTYRPSFFSIVSSRLANVFTRGSEERAGFQLVWKLSGRLRDFKLKVYPGMGYVAVIAGLMIFNHFKRSGNAGFEAFFTTGFVLGLTYSSGLLLLTAINQLQYSENFKASWFYLIAPIKSPGHLFSGAIKAIFAKFFLPIALVIAIFVIAVLGWQVIPNLILGFSNIILSSLLVSLVTFRNFPFSMQQSSANQTGMMMRTFACMFLAGVIGFIHYLIFSFLPVVCIVAVLSLIACWLMLTSMKTRSWKTIKASYDI